MTKPDLASPACEAVRDNLAALVAGDPAVLTVHGEHLAGCDACRDLRYDAERVAPHVAAAGADYEPPADLAERVLAALGDNATPTVKPASTASPRRWWLGPAVALGAVTAAAAGVAVVASRSSTAQDSSTEQAAISSAPSAGKVTNIERAASATPSSGTGLQIRLVNERASSSLAAGQPIPDGATISSDGRTRAWLTLASGASVALDQGTEFWLDQQTLHLTAGRVVVDAPDREAAFVIATSAGEVVTGERLTRVMVTATAEQSSARVLRGLARVQGSVALRGEEALFSSGSQTLVTAIPGATSDVAWSERAPAAATDAPRGLGSLRAYRPGEKRDRDWRLALQSHDVQVRIAGPLARTEVTETFRNDTDHELEGVFVFPLPADAKIDDLALDVPGGFEHGAIIAKARAKKIWNGVIDKAAPQLKRPAPSELIWVPGRWKDPALLDWQHDGRVELRVFPIPAHGSRTIKVAYTQVAATRGPARQYSYPMAHAADASTAAEKFSFDLEVRGARKGSVNATGYAFAAKADDGSQAQGLSMQATAFVPAGDVLVRFEPEDHAAEVRAWTYAGAAALAPDEALAAKRKVGNDPAVIAAQRLIAADLRPTAVLAIHPTLPRWREGVAHDIAIVVDASQSMVGERWARAQALVSSMVGDLDGRDRVTVLACDDDCTSSGQLAPASAARGVELATWLGTQAPAGASDPVAAIRMAVAEVPAAPDRERIILYVGDGVASTGLRRVADVHDAVAAEVNDKVQAGTLRIGSVAIGPDSNAALLSAIANGGGGSAVPWTAGQGVSEVARAALDSTSGVALRNVSIELPSGLVDAAPTKLGTIRAGEEILMAARVSGTDGNVSGDLILRGTVGGEKFEQRYPLQLAVSTAAGNRFVPKLWASLAIDQLDADGQSDSETKAVAMSQAYGVLSQHTSMLVLESQAMFDAFGVDRRTAVANFTGEDEVEETLVDGMMDVAGPPAQPAPPSPATKSSQGMASSRARRDMALDDADESRATSTTSVVKPTAEKAKQDSRAFAKQPGPPPPPSPDSGLVRRPSSFPRGGGRGGQWMKKVWHRVATVQSGGAVDPAIVETLRAALVAVPDSRERHRDLVQALAYAGDVDGALEIAHRWLERDALDPQALDYIADLLGRTGKRDLALRTLAGTIDLAVDDIARHERLALAYEAVGRLRQACGHKQALAALEPTDPARAGAAMACSRSLARPADAEYFARALPSDAVRVRAEQLATASALPNPPRGDLLIKATWQGDVDLDLSVITGSGRRWSWQGGRTDLAVADVVANGRETLAVRSLKRGSYRVEVVRPASAPTGILRGTIDITVLGVRRTLPFELVGDRLVVGDIRVRSESQLVPA